MILAGVSCLHETLYQDTLELSARAAAVLEGVIVRHELTEGALFSTRYHEIPGTNPKKYRTEYDNFTDRTVRPLLEEFLSSHAVLTYAIAVDLEG